MAMRRAAHTATTIQTLRSPTRNDLKRGDFQERAYQVGVPSLHVESSPQETIQDHIKLINDASLQYGELSLSASAGYVVQTTTTKKILL